MAKKYADITLPNFRYMSAEIISAGGRPGSGDIKSMTAVEEYRLRDKAYAPMASWARRCISPKGVTTNAMPSVVEEYYERLHAPDKSLVWFERSGHDPCFEEPAKFQSFLVDKVLAETRTSQ